MSNKSNSEGLPKNVWFPLYYLKTKVFLKSYCHVKPLLKLTCSRRSLSLSLALAHEVSTHKNVLFRSYFNNYISYQRKETNLYVLAHLPFCPFLTKHSYPNTMFNGKL